ncbi:hypothetical protein KAW55_05340 [bacterium]|nr:hypothetical protein [bacterium]
MKAKGGLRRGASGQMRKLPKFLEKYFWDVEFEKITFKKSKVYILRRILEYGDEEAVAWMWKNFKKSEIKNALSNFRGYSQKSANFWAFILNVKKDRVKCLNKSFRAIQKQFWPY